MVAPENASVASLREAAPAVVAIATSAGGLDPLVEVISALPADIAAGIIVIQHTDPHYRTMLPGILQHKSYLKVKTANDGDRIESGTIYVAPPDWHIVLNQDGIISLSQAPLVHYVRPSADVLFRSIANSYKGRAVCVILSGTGRDGADGAQAVRRSGGYVIVQEPTNAKFDGMPRAAIGSGDIDLVLSASEISAAIVDIVTAGASQ